MPQNVLDKRVALREMLETEAVELTASTHYTIKQFYRWTNSIGARHAIRW